MYEITYFSFSYNLIAVGIHMNLIWTQLQVYTILLKLDKKKSLGKKFV